MARGEICVKAPCLPLLHAPTELFKTAKISLPNFPCKIPLITALLTQELWQQGLHILPYVNYCLISITQNLFPKQFKRIPDESLGI